jgi:hypothetical protein
MKSGRTLGFLAFIQLCFTMSLFAAVEVTVHPAKASLTLTEPQQYTATVVNTTNHSVLWFVDGIRGGNSTVGTISTSGLYHPPAKRSFHTIKAASVAQPSATGSAQVWITDYPGILHIMLTVFAAG